MDAFTRSVDVPANARFDSDTTSGSTVKPYLPAGLGFYNNSTSAEECSNQGRARDVGVQASGGLEFQLAGFSTFAEVEVREYVF